MFTQTRPAPAEADPQKTRNRALTRKLPAPWRCIYQCGIAPWRRYSALVNRIPALANPFRCIPVLFRCYSGAIPGGLFWTVFKGGLVKKMAKKLSLGEEKKRKINLKFLFFSFLFSIRSFSPFFDQIPLENRQKSPPGIAPECAGMDFGNPDTKAVCKTA